MHPSLQPDEPKLPKMDAKNVLLWSGKDSSAEGGITVHQLQQKRNRNWQKSLLFENLWHENDADDDDNIVGELIGGGLARKGLGRQAGPKAVKLEA